MNPSPSRVPARHSSSVCVYCFEPIWDDDPDEVVVAFEHWHGRCLKWWHEHHEQSAP